MAQVYNFRKAVAYGLLPGLSLPVPRHFMNVHVSYKAGKTPEVEREFHNQIQKLRRRLQVFKPELVHLRAFVEQDGSRRASSSLNLRLPSGQMAAQRSGGGEGRVCRSADSSHQAQGAFARPLDPGPTPQTGVSTPAWAKPPQSGDSGLADRT